jgi:hypothetical protein
VQPVQVYDPNLGEMKKEDRQYGKTLNQATVGTAFLNFAGW